MEMNKGSQTHSRKFMGLFLAFMLLFSLSTTGMVVGFSVYNHGKNTIMAYRGYLVHLNLPVVKLIFKRN
jgi:hypothetical protein